MDYKLRKAEPRDVSDILRLVKVDVPKQCMLFGPVWIRRYGSYSSVAWREFTTSGDDRSRVSSRLRSRLHPSDRLPGLGARGMFPNMVNLRFRLCD